MDSFNYVAGVSQHQHQQPPRPSSARPFGHFRSLSSVASTSSASLPLPFSPPNKTRPSSKSSVTPLPSEIAFWPAHLVPVLNDEMSTLPDPRTRHALGPTNENAVSNPRHHPDLDTELATLSAKLVNSINHQTLLDDTLSATRHELQTARDRIQDLEAQNQSQRDMMAGNVWVRRSSLDAERKVFQAEKKSWQAKLAEETSRRLETEKEQRKIEQELENLTTALFEEANKMVIGAKEEAQSQIEALQRKNDQWRSQLSDSESLLKSQQEQLSQLKSVMEHMTAERDDQTNGTAPPSPGFARCDCTEHHRSPLEGSDGSPPSSSDSLPCNPTSLQHLVQPVLRTDLASYEDFVTLARTSHQRRGSRISSGSLGGIAALAIGLGGSTSSAHPSNASTTSLGASAQAANSAPQSPDTPASTSSASLSNVSGPPTPNLKDSRFYKRVLADDIEPTLRLDAAPGLSWLARRSVLASVTDGSLIVEPIPNSSTYIAIVKPHLHACSLCGESRKTTEHLRNHRFRTSEADSAHRYPLCGYCLHRVRSTCDFLAFLRFVKDGHWRADDEDQEKAAWEESVKLREQMFWARIGGGVVPACQAAVSAPAEMDEESRPSREVVSTAENGEIDEVNMANTKVAEADDRVDETQIAQIVTTVDGAKTAADVDGKHPTALEGDENFIGDAQMSQKASENSNYHDDTTDCLGPGGLA